MCVIYFLMEICERVLNFSVCFSRFLSVLWGGTPYFCCEKRNGLSELAFERVTCQKNYKGEICPTIRNASKKHNLNSQVMACVSNLNKIKMRLNSAQYSFLLLSIIGQLFSSLSSRVIPRASNN